MTPVDRRHFLGAAATTAAAVSLSSTARAQSAGSDKIRCAVIGVNGRGSAHISSIENSKEGQVTLLCDPDSKVLAARAGGRYNSRYTSYVTVPRPGVPIPTPCTAFSQA